MSENEYLDNEEEIVTGDESQDEYQEEEDTLEPQEEESEDEPQPPKKKSLVQTLRDEIKELKKAKKEGKTQPLDQDLEMRLFFIENPELKEDKEGILGTLEKHPTLTPLQAHALYKAEKPKESESKKESFKGGSYKPKPKTIDDLSEDEAEKTLSPTQWVQYLKKKGKLK